MVESVIGLEPELGSHLIFEDPILIEGGVPVLVAGAAEVEGDGAGFGFDGYGARDDGGDGRVDRKSVV